MIGLESQCHSCVHYTRSRLDDTRAAKAPAPACAAFPAGIPDNLLDNGADHREAYPGDRGVRWTSDGRPFPDYAFEILRELMVDE